MAPDPSPRADVRDARLGPGDRPANVTILGFRLVPRFAASCWRLLREKGKKRATSLSGRRVARSPRGRHKTLGDS
jgi:hypothetical protein